MNVLKSTKTDNFYIYLFIHLKNKSLYLEIITGHVNEYTYIPSAFFLPNTGCFFDNFFQ